jgi:stress-induced morphogen
MCAAPCGWQCPLGNRTRLADMTQMQVSPPDRASRLRSALDAAFEPDVLEIADESSRHAGHAGARPGGQTHYAVLLVSPAFRGLSRVERSRAVNGVLAPEFAGGMHALSLTLRTPEEHAAAS